MEYGSVLPAADRVPFSIWVSTDIDEVGGGDEHQGFGERELVRENYRAGTVTSEAFYCTMFKLVLGQQIPPSQDQIPL